MLNELRKRTQSRYKLPKVEATRTPRLDHVLKTLAPQAARTTDRELARIQSFVLAPISTSGREAIPVSQHWSSDDQQSLNAHTVLHISKKIHETNNTQNMALVGEKFLH